MAYSLFFINPLCLTPFAPSALDDPKGTFTKLPLLCSPYMRIAC
jgi:hypothetical protein